MNATSAEYAFLATRDLGLHVYGHLLGIWCRAIDSKTCEGTLDLAPFALDETGGPALGVLASLGDMAMQTVLLPAYPDMRLITRTLNVRRVSTKRCGALRACARAVHAGSKLAMSEATVEDEGGRMVGVLSATFVPIAPPVGWRPLPWEAGLARPNRDQLLGGAPLRADQSQASQALKAVLQKPNVGYANLLGVGKGECVEGTWRSSWPLQEHLLNRAREAQGGAIFGALGQGLDQGLPAGAVPFEQTVTFFRSVKEDVVIEAEMLHLGRRFATAMARMRDTTGGLAAVSWTEYEFQYSREKASTPTGGSP